MKTASKWSRVTDQSPCPVCKSASWCSISSDGAIVSCMRVSDGSYKTLETNSGETYLHRIGERPSKGIVSIARPASPPDRANAEFCDQVYRALLAELTLTAAHHVGLTERGLSGEAIVELLYRTLPIAGRARIAAKLHERFRDALLGVPGFIVREKEGNSFLTLAGAAGLLLPCSNADGKIIALNVRRDDSGTGKRYSWISSKSNGGPGPGAPTHVPRSIKVRPVKRGRLTEGLIKSDVATHLNCTPTLGVGGVGSWKSCLPVLTALGIEIVVLAFDADARRNKTVATALRSCVRGLRKAGFTVELEVWDEAQGKGIDDLLAAGGTPEVVTGKTVDDALAKIAAAAQADESTETADRIKVEVTPDEHVVNDAACIALANDPAIYQRGGELVHVIRSAGINDGIHRPDDAPHVVAIQLAGIRERLSRVAQFVAIVTRGENEQFEHVHPPDWCVKAVAVRGQWNGIPTITGITSVPVLRPDGTILDTPGYDAVTGLLFDPDGIEYRIPERPTQDDARRAAGLLHDIVTDFPFKCPAHRSGWLASLLTPFARRAFHGPAPLFLTDSNIRGSGKGLLNDVTAEINIGREMSRMTNPRDDEEARKRITSLMLAGDPLILVDNIAGTLGCASLDAALTATYWKDRPLGRTEIVEGPLNATWYGTGNNVVLIGDTCRRTVYIRLESPLENPEQRDGFKYRDLLAHVRQHRAELVSAVLTILRAFCVAGRPRQKIPTWGSFEGWSAIVRQAIVWIGLPDPAEAREELVSTSDRESTALRQLIAGWVEVDPDDAGLTTAELLKLLTANQNDYEAVRSGLLELCDPPKGCILPTARSVGNRLKHLRGRNVGGKALVSREDAHTKAMKWRVETLVAESAASADSVCTPSYAGAHMRTHAHAHANGVETESAEYAESATDTDVWPPGRE